MTFLIFSGNNQMAGPFGFPKNSFYTMDISQLMHYNKLNIVNLKSLESAMKY